MTDDQMAKCEAAWVRRKLFLPASASLQDVQVQMHILCSNAHGYVTYIQSHKCDDKQGEIARLSVANAALVDAVTELEAFVRVMFGRGPEAVIPETVGSPLGVPLKLREIVSSARRAIIQAGGQ